jgi:hypothetical protein
MQNVRVIQFGIFLICGLYQTLCVVFWLAVSGMPNAIDNDPGLPFIFDVAMAASMVIVASMTFVSIRQINSWIPRKLKRNKTKSKWDNSAGSMPGPKVSKNASKRST